ncbi:hypothetical protein BDZ45DRAFT_505989 [Acephala macrosclerotiorum]|nr:hypothetical protein BDZ45DRAFT_505989 [Acephala macrosclerotiorum]
MYSPITNILISPITLVSTTITSLLISCLITKQIKTHGAIPIFRLIIRYNSIIYSIFSLALFIRILILITTSLPSIPTFKSIICQKLDAGLETFEGNLRLIYHASKIYEYVDIFSALANGRHVNMHFWVHHFTVLLPFALHLSLSS